MAIATLFLVLGLVIIHYSKISEYVYYKKNLNLVLGNICQQLLPWQHFLCWFYLSLGGSFMYQTHSKILTNIFRIYLLQGYPNYAIGQFLCVQNLCTDINQIVRICCLQRELGLIGFSAITGNKCCYCLNAKKQKKAIS